MNMQIHLESKFWLVEYKYLFRHLGDEYCIDARNRVYLLHIIKQEIDIVESQGSVDMNVNNRMALTGWLHFLRLDFGIYWS